MLLDDYSRYEADEGVRVDTPNILFPNKYQRFWLFWDVTASATTVMFGRGWEIGDNVLVAYEFSVPQSEIKYLSVTTYQLQQATFVFLN